MLILGISTSAGSFSLALKSGDQIIFDSIEDRMSRDKDIALQLEQALEAVGKPITALSQIIVDNGPGGTSSVRTGVAFANSLGYTLGIPVFPVTSLEIMGAYVWDTYQLPAISTVKSMKNDIYAGLYRHGEPLEIVYGDADEVILSLMDGVSELVVTGHLREKIIEGFAAKKVIDSAIDFGDAKMMLKYMDTFQLSPHEFPKLVYPLTEQKLSNA